MRTRRDHAPKARGHRGEIDRTVIDAVRRVTAILLRDVDQAQTAVVVDDGHEVQALADAGFDLRAGHAESAVADRAQHRADPETGSRAAIAAGRP